MNYGDYDGMINKDVVMKLIESDKPKIIVELGCSCGADTAEAIRGGLNILKKTKYFYTEITEETLHGYEGDILYTDLLNLMESINFELVFKFKHDALFRNKNETNLSTE